MATKGARIGGTELPPNDEEELLLIVSGLGTLHEAVGDEPAEYWIGEDCKECIGDLQRYLRRDDKMSMAAHRALGSWRVLQQHLLPLLKVCSDSDMKLCFNVLKVVVQLTMKTEHLGAMPLHAHVEARSGGFRAISAPPPSPLELLCHARRRACCGAHRRFTNTAALHARSLPDDRPSEGEEGARLCDRRTRRRASALPPLVQEGLCPLRGDEQCVPSARPPSPDVRRCSRPA